MFTEQDIDLFIEDDHLNINMSDNVTAFIDSLEFKNKFVLGMNINKLIEHFILVNDEFHADKINRLKKRILEFINKEDKQND